MEGQQKVKAELDKGVFKQHFKSADFDKAKTFTLDEAVDAIHSFYDKHGHGDKVTKDVIKSVVEPVFKKVETKGKKFTGKNVRKLARKFATEKKSPDSSVSSVSSEGQKKPAEETKKPAAE